MTKFTEEKINELATKILSNLNKSMKIIIYKENQEKMFNKMKRTLTRMSGNEQAEKMTDNEIVSSLTNVVIVNAERGI